MSKHYDVSDKNNNVIFEGLDINDQTYTLSDLLLCNKR